MVTAGIAEAISHQQAHYLITLARCRCPGPGAVSPLRLDARAASRSSCPGTRLTGAPAPACPSPVCPPSVPCPSPRPSVLRPPSTPPSLCCTCIAASVCERIVRPLDPSLHSGPALGYCAISALLTRPDITVMVDWALKINYLSIYLSVLTGCPLSRCSGSVRALYSGVLAACPLFWCSGSVPYILAACPLFCQRALCSDSVPSVLTACPLFWQRVLCSDSVPSVLAACPLF